MAIIKWFLKAYESFFSLIKHLINFVDRYESPSEKKNYGKNFKKEKNLQKVILLKKKKNVFMKKQSMCEKRNFKAQKY